jgi:hypothetical protein
VHSSQLGQLRYLLLGCGGKELQTSIDLSRWRKCAEGHQREIYQSPDDPDVLIKVLKGRRPGDKGARKTSRKRGWYTRFRRFGAYMTFRREIEEYLEQARKLDGSQQFELPIARIVGLSHTSMGLGLLVERIANRDGTLAPTLIQLISSGRLANYHLRLIDSFFAICRREHIVMMDINPGNFVITDRSGVEEIVCIDGTGEKHFFRIYARSRILNSIKLHYAREKLLRKMARHQSMVEKEKMILALAPSEPAGTSAP